MRYCYIDTETTGLNPDEHEIIEIAIITEYDDGSVVNWSSKVRPAHIETAHPKALEINGYNEDDWADAPSQRVVAKLVSQHLKGAIVVGHNVRFDIEFIDALFSQQGVKHRWKHRDQIDTITLVREHLFPTGLKSASLDNTRRWLGWSLEGAHSALKDAEDCMRLRHTLERSSRFQRLRWSILGPLRMAVARR